jgi:HPt (histidine-containing phosphotransfer) domain-containing protein
VRDAGILAHTLAGTAGQIGADPVARAAHELEAALRNGAGYQSAGLVQTVAAALAETLAALDALPPVAPVADSHVGSVSSSADVDDALRALGDAISKNQVRAAKMFTSVQREFAGTPGEVVAGILAEQLGRLDFVAASESLRQLVALSSGSHMAPK